MWFHRAVVGSSTTVVFFHGNGENLQKLVHQGQFTDFQRAGLNFVAIDYPGLGRSQGSPEQATLVNAGLVALDFARSHFPDTRLVLWGRSLGAGVTMQVARQRFSVIDQLILVSPWTNFRDVATAMTEISNQIPADWFAKNTYDSVGVARTLTIPTLIVHGEKDGVIPAQLGQRLHTTFPSGVSRLVIQPGVGHEDIGFDSVFWGHVLAFLSSK